jgi:asparagine synthase (glutamine-hydrolysing)
MRDTLIRRGPDQKGLYVEGPAALIHTRLSVVDPENGRQPMSLSWAGEDYILVYNGELYNTEEIRAELAARDHRFQGHSDTEVLLHAYAQWGGDCLTRLNGIFAFAVWEKQRQRLFLARDRIGVKPLFYCRRGSGLLFASELKALLAHPAAEAVIDRQGVAEILMLGPGRTPGCGVFRGIEELPPASWAIFTADGLRTGCYWKLEDRGHEESFDQTVEHVRELVVDSIRRQLVSDVPVGTFLSGGLDSSIISSVAGQYFRERNQPLHTFSVDYEDNDQFFTSSKFQPDSDNAYLDEMRRYLGSEHHAVVLKTAQLADALYAAVDARDLPGMADVDSSLLLFCEEIKQHVTVALSGECADEIFGGYPWYRDPEIRAREGFPWAQSTDYRASFVKPEFGSSDELRQYVDRRYRQTVASADVRPGLPPQEKRMREMVSLNLQWFMQTLLDAGEEIRYTCFCRYARIV